MDAYTPGDSVVFNFQRDGNGNLLTRRAFQITAVIEDGADLGLDYAVLELDGKPGSVYGYRETAGMTTHPVMIIQHPSGEPKMLDAGSDTHQRNDRITYGDIDTGPGSSGSGLLSRGGELIGVHTNGGCHSSGGRNSGVSMAAIYQVSSVLPIADMVPGGELYASYPFKNGSPKDASGNGHHAVFGRWEDYYPLPLPAQDRFGEKSAVKLEFVCSGGNRVIVPMNDVETVYGAVSMFFKFSSTWAGLGKQYMVSVPGNESVVYARISKTGSELHATLNSSLEEQYEKDIEIDRWYNLVVTFSPEATIMYLDGEKFFHQNTADIVLKDRLVLGKNSRITLDDVKVYTGGIDEAQLTALLRQK